MSATLFYSERCAHCARLFKEYPYIQNDYSFVNVDQIKPIPEFLRVVPTLVVVDDSEQNPGQKVYEGTQVFRFVEDRPPVEAYSFSCENTTNKGFAFIQSDRPVYSEQCNYSPF
jgi:glutaredoxin-related protein